MSANTHLFNLELHTRDGYAVVGTSMAKEVSKTQIDRLGDRLKSGSITEADLRLLDQYRRTYTAAYEGVVGDIRNKLGLEPTGRPAKSTISIIDKLKRESIRLTQIQDIAGCRIIVADITEQKSVIQSLTDLFPQATVIDRRAQPSHGYRAVHVVVNCEGKLIEIQVRTALQHAWAETSEKLSDVVDASIKYGGGHTKLQVILQLASALIAVEETAEGEIEVSSDILSDEGKQALDILDIAREGPIQLKLVLFKVFHKLVDIAPEEFKGQK